MIRQSVLASVAVLCGLWGVTNSAVAQDCDVALVQQTSSERNEDNYSLAWLDLVNKSNFSVAKDSAPSSVIAGMMTGGYDSFSVQRDKYKQSKSYKLTTSQSRESFKSFLSKEQIGAWVECKAGRQELAAWYENVTDTSATIYVQWSAPDTVGALTIKSFTVENAIVSGNSGLRVDDKLIGDRAFIVTRQNGEAIHGAIEGEAGIVKRSFATDIYIPARQQAIVEAPPKRIVVSTAGSVIMSRAKWNTGEKDFDCGITAEGMDRVDVAARWEKRVRTKEGCIKNYRYCNGHGETCYNKIISTGCFVNREWHDWYKARTVELNIPYSASAVCQRQ